MYWETKKIKPIELFVSLLGFIIFAFIMSPRALMINGFDFFFYSMEEERMHIHIEKGDCDAKFWLEPTIELVYNHGFTSKEIKNITQYIEEYERTIKDKWNYHFRKE